MEKITVNTLIEKKRNNQPLTWLAVYDYPTAQMVEEAGVDIILMGDSIGMNVFGYDTTLQMTIDILIPHTAAVRKGAPNVFLIGDMPYMSYQVSIEEATRNAGRFMAECGCDAVKIEGGSEVLDVVKALVKATIPVVGHIGITPQAFSMQGGFKAQGRYASAALQIIEDAQALEEAGICLLIVNGVPPEVAKIITERAKIPVIGIAAGPYVDGQCLAVCDVLGMLEGFKPRFVKTYANMREQMFKAIKDFVEDVKIGGFPGPEHCYGMPKEEIEKLQEMLEKREIRQG